MVDSVCVPFGRTPFRNWGDCTPPSTSPGAPVFFNFSTIFFFLLDLRAGRPPPRLSARSDAIAALLSLKPDFPSRSLFPPLEPGLCIPTPHSIMHVYPLPVSRAYLRMNRAGNVGSLDCPRTPGGRLAFFLVNFLSPGLLFCKSVEFLFSRRFSVNDSLCPW